MEIFMRNITYGAIADDIKIVLAPILHRPPFISEPPMNFGVKLFKNKGCGILTLPNEQDGSIFLAKYPNVLFRGRNIHFERSRNPLNLQKIERLRTRPWEDPKELRRERTRASKNASGTPLTSLAFGRLCRDGSFSAEFEATKHVQVACDIEARRLCLSLPSQVFTFTPQPHVDIEAPRLSLSSQVLALVPQSHTTCLSSISQIALGFSADILWDFSDDTSINISYPSAGIIALASTSNDQETHHLYLEARTPPEIVMMFPSETPPRRQTSIDDTEELFLLTKYVCLTFGSRGTLETFLARCKQVFSVPCLDVPPPPLMRRNLYSKVNFDRLHEFLKSLEFGLAYQVEKAVMASILDPLEVLETLNDSILGLERVAQDHAAAIFRHFVQTLYAPSFSQIRRSKTRRCRRNWPRRDVASVESPSLSCLLQESKDQYYRKLERPKGLFSPSPAIYQSFQLIVTPSTKILEGPLPDRGNAVLRRFGHHECFLRVSFSDEGRHRLFYSTGLTAGEPVGKRYLCLMTKGFQLAGRQWEFLGYSMSGLREHSVWFVRPFLSDDGQSTMNADRIRHMLGDFSKLERKPARLAARWSQVFTASDPSITLNSDQIKHIDDRFSEDGTSTFTDGCGTISLALACDVWSTLQSHKRKPSLRKKVPSCWQIRIGGAKGVLVVDPTLQGKVICLRPSQVKFDDARQVQSLDIASTSAKPMPLFLNRPIIVLLEYLGVPLENFMRHQNAAITQVEESRASMIRGSYLFQQHGLGVSFHLTSVMKHLHEMLNFDIAPPPGSSCQPLSLDIINDSLTFAAIHVLREVKYRAHIPIPGSFTLLGVSDEHDCLEEGQIYATIDDERNGLYKRILGKVLITRPPQIHPGDVQFVEAVDRPELDHLRNVVVFSCRGARSLPSCLGGGDLDGDHYNLILDPDLFSMRTSTPGSYVGLPDKTTENPCTIHDVANFVLDYMKSDQVGRIAVLHLRIADKHDPAHPDCIKLAELASHAVDFPKTGAAADYRSFPSPPSPTKPDFLAREGTKPDSTKYYESKKALGHLFRNVPLEKFQPVELKEAYSHLAWNEIGYALLDGPLRDFELPHPSNELNEEMDYIMYHYEHQLQAIAQTHTLSRNPNHRLSEAELVSGTIQANWVDHRRRRDAVTAMNLQTQELVTAVRRELRRTNLHSPEEGDIIDDEDDENDDEEEDDEGWFDKERETMLRCYAAWNVAIAALKEEPDAFGPQSFALIALGLLLKILRKLTTELPIRNGVFS